MESQKIMVLNHLKSGKSITQKEAIDLFGAYRLSDIIYRLRQQGYDISCEIKYGKNRYGNTVNWAEYWLYQN